MSFNNHAQKVRNSQSAYFVRRSAFYSCVSNFCWLTKKSYRKVRALYSEKFGLDNPIEQNPNQLLSALDELIAVRNRFLEKLHAFERKRIKEKMRGKRTPKKTELEKIYTE